MLQKLKVLEIDKITTVIMVILTSYEQFTLLASKGTKSVQPGLF